MSKRIRIETGIFLRVKPDRKISENCFEVVKSKDFKCLNPAQQLFRYLLLNVSDQVYMYKHCGSYRVEFRKCVDTLDNAIKLHKEVSEEFNAWLRGDRIVKS